MTSEQIAERLHARSAGSDRWRGKCPVHGGKSLTSLSVSRGEGGRTLVKCWGGCAVKDICAAVGLRVTDLFEHQTPRKPMSPVLRSAQRTAAEVSRHLTKLERIIAEPVFIRTTPENLDFAIARALALTVEGELCQIAFVENQS